jgi:hypothetical protein
VIFQTSLIFQTGLWKNEGTKIVAKLVLGKILDMGRMQTG